MAARISVVLPVYNQAHFLPHALDSVFAQTHRDVELIVVNDGSTDATAEILHNYQTEHSFTVIDQTNQGLPKALNAGFAQAQGDYLTWTSSDNIMLPNMLTTLAGALDANPSDGLVYADRFLIDDDGADLGRFNLPDYDPYLLLHVNLVHCCFLYRRICMQRIGNYDPKFIYGEDWEYWIRMSQYYRMLHVPQALYKYRLHRQSMTGEIMRGTARNMTYAQFTARIRRRMPARWYLGKLKWWWMRVAKPESPVVALGESWRQAVVRQAGGAS